MEDAEICVVSFGITARVAKNAINEALHPLGVAVVIEAKHLCMSMRGVQKQDAVTTTSDFIGAFERESTREEFFQLIGSNLH
jgi:GTP cyclohydrolase I